MDKSKIKNFIKRIIPPIIIDIYRKSRGDSPYFWNGIYKDFSEIPQKGSYDNDKWINFIYEYTKDIILDSNEDKTIPTRVADERVLLPLLVSLISKHSDQLTIIDWGGGMGTDYISLRKSVLNLPHIAYHVVETPQICNRGRELFENDNNIHFHTSLPSSLSDVDIVYICCAMQYHEDYKSLLKSLCAYQAKYILFSKLNASDNETFATTQINIPNAVIPCWFFNVNQLIEIMSLWGYKLIYKSASLKYDQQNFPENYRLTDGRCCNLLFSS